FAVVGPVQQWRRADGALGERELAVDASVRTSHARNGQSRCLDPSEIVAWTVEVEERFWQSNRAPTGRTQVDEGQRIDLEKANLLRQFILPQVVFAISHLHALDIQKERISGEQSLAAAVPVIELDQGLAVQLGSHQLALHRLLGAAGNVKGEAIVLVVEAR